MAIFLFFLGLVLVAPAVVARFFQQARWKTIGIGFALWFGGLVMMGLLSGNPGEGLGWAAILAIFLSIVMVPLIVAMLHHFGLPKRPTQAKAYARRLPAPLPFATPGRRSQDRI